jgi:hypothetical protein
MKKNTKLEKIAKKVLVNVDQKENDNYGIDPITIIIVIGVLLSLIRVIQECRKKRTLLKNKNELAGVIKRDIQELVLKDSWFNNLRLKRILKQHLTKDQYRVYGSVLQNNIMEVGVNLTEEEICTLMEAAND